MAVGPELQVHRSIRFTLLVTGAIMFDRFVHAYRGEYGFPLGVTVFF
jgi:hypothetical protein